MVGIPQEAIPGSDERGPDVKREVVLRCPLSRARTRLGLLALSMVIAACTPLLDRDPAQCRTDADCAHFGGHPYCRDSVCVSSGLMPLGCFFATATHQPIEQEDFLNQCGTTYLRGESPGQCLTFPPVSGADATLRDPPDAGARPSSTNGDAGTVSADGGTVSADYPSCNEVTQGRALYMTGSSNFPPLLQRLTPIILNDINRTPVFLTTNSCRGVRSMYNATDHVIVNPLAGSPADSYAQYFSPEGQDGHVVGKPCKLDPGQEVDVGESETFPATCSLMTDSAKVHEVQGPILAILFVVPINSQQKAISEQAAHLVFGAGGYPPWNDPALLYVRASGTATTQLIARAIHVDPTKFWGNDQLTADRLAQNLQFVTGYDPAQSAIGILGADVYDSYRAKLKALAYQDDRQQCAYTPDSNSNLQNVRDKINVRNGHYPIWGPIHFFATKTAGNIDSAAAEDFIKLFPAQYPKDVLDAFIDSGWVPECAMSVRRDDELGNLKPASPPFLCGCHFDSRVNGDQVPPGCTPCETPSQCMAKDPNLTACNYGFCEMQ